MMSYPLIVEVDYKLCLEIVFVSFSYGVPGQVWYLIVSITDYLPSCLLSSSLGPVVNILAIFSNANILKI